jgi:drug/metabolite transporter (DMT)-like permease
LVSSIINERREAVDTEPPQSQLISRYVLLVFIWSTTPLAVVLSIREFHPMWSLAIRFALSAPFAGLCLWLMKESLPLTRAAFRSYLAGTLSLFGAMIFTYLGAAYLPSSLISLLFGLAPLLVGLLAHGVFRTQLLRAEQWLGLCMAFAGLLVIFGHSNNEAHPQGLGILYIMIGVSCYVGSVFWLKHEDSGIHPLAQTTGALILSAIAMAFVLPFYWDKMPTHLPNLVTISAIMYSVIMASVVAMFCYFYLAKHLRPATVSLTTMLTPVLALIWGFWLNNERFTQFTWMGMAAIMMGLMAYFVRDINVLWQKV